MKGSYEMFTLNVTARAAWALAHPNPQVLSFFGMQVSTLYSEFEHSSTEVVWNWVRKLNFLGVFLKLNSLGVRPELVTADTFTLYCSR